jgi:flagellar biogenesis protein FliO
MKTDKQKFFLTLFLALLLLLAVIFAYAWYVNKETIKEKPVAVCGKQST